MVSFQALKLLFVIFNLFHYLEEHFQQLSYIFPFLFTCQVIVSLSFGYVYLIYSFGLCSNGSKEEFRF